MPDTANFLYELSLIFKIFNEFIFDGKLKSPSHVIQLDKKVVFRFDPSSHNMCVGSKLPDVSMDDMLADYLHEMVHMENNRLGLSGITGNQYHKKQFLQTALGAGFYVGKHKNKGWAITKFNKQENFKQPFPTAEKQLSHCLLEMRADKKVIDDGKKTIARMIASASPAKICFLKYVCGCQPPHNSIRSGRRPDGPNPLNITCNNCNSKFALEA